MTTASTNNQRDGRGSIPRGIDRLIAGIADARKETPIETNRRLCAMARIQRKEADSLPGRFGMAWATLNQLAPAKPATRGPVTYTGAEVAADFKGISPTPPAPLPRGIRFEGIPVDADEHVDLRAVQAEQAADLRRKRIKCDCCPDCGEPLTEFEQAFDSLGHEIPGKQTRECSDSCGWDGEERNTPARSWR